MLLLGVAVTRSNVPAFYLLRRDMRRLLRCELVAIPWVFSRGGEFAAKICGEILPLFPPRDAQDSTDLFAVSKINMHTLSLLYSSPTHLLGRDVRRNRARVAGIGRNIDIFIIVGRVRRTWHGFGNMNTKTTVPLRGVCFRPPFHHCR